VSFRRKLQRQWARDRGISWPAARLRWRYLKHHKRDAQKVMDAQRERDRRDKERAAVHLRPKWWERLGQFWRGRDRLRRGVWSRAR